jgi:hypothetical protein
MTVSNSAVNFAVCGAFELRSGIAWGTGLKADAVSAVGSEERNVSTDMGDLVCNRAQRRMAIIIEGEFLNQGFFRRTTDHSMIKGPVLCIFTIDMGPIAQLEH